MAHFLKECLWWLDVIQLVLSRGWLFIKWIAIAYLNLLAIAPLNLNVGAIARKFNLELNRFAINGRLPQELGCSAAFRLGRSRS
ncbi:hypothetical protein H6G64_10250 [Calothrix sp. FACHB-156]|nr:hypothetical protein [Calothrix sp. FACHB-156]